MARVEYFRKKTLSTKWIMVGLIISLGIIVSSILLFFYPFASKVKIDYLKGQFPIIFDNMQYGNGLIEGNTVFIPVEFVKEQLDDSLTFDESSQSIIITTKNKVVQMPTESLTYYVNEKPVNLNVPAIKSSNNELYVSIEPLLAYYPIQYQKLQDTNAIMILTDGQEIMEGKIRSQDVHHEKLRLRTAPNLQSPYTAEVVADEKVTIEKQESNYFYIRKENGIAGFIHQSLVSKGKSEKLTLKREEKPSKTTKINGPIMLTWEAVYKQNPNVKIIPEMPGVNVVSPTWFELEDASGTIKNLGSLEYAKWAQSKGYQVWGLFSNAFDPELTHLVFKDFETRQKMIRQLLHYSQMYQLDGVNIDIENVNVEDGPYVTQFVREATPYFHDAGLTVSMDITFISTSGNWSVFYEREKLGKIVDYLVVMAYDEHWGSSPVAGSVASLPWVERNLERLLEIVPHESLILGVPLYTRLWKEETLTNGEKKMTSKALSMAKIKEWLEENKLQPTYDPVSGQNYAELLEENITYRVWLEDELSLKKRANLVGKYQLAGIASWSRYFADETAWAALNFGDEKYTDANPN